MGAIRSRRTIWGFNPADLLGIIVMLIPFSITFKEFTYVKGLFLWVTTNVPTYIRPGLVSSICAVAFYGALIIRCQLFKVDTLEKGIVSAVRAFLNCWVIASLMTMIVPTEKVAELSLGAFLNNNQSTFLLLGIILSWLGMRTVSGYCWILFVIAAWNNILKLDQAMGMWGALYIITFAVGLLLQITNYVELADLVKDFKGGISRYTPKIRANMSSAAEDAKVRTKKAAEYARTQFSGEYSKNSYRINRDGTTRVENRASQKARPKTNKIPAGNASDLLNALDVNGDGVIDEEDIRILQNRNEDNR